jgi:hypothetical protein
LFLLDQSNERELRRGGWIGKRDSDDSGWLQLDCCEQQLVHRGHFRRERFR